MKRALLIKDVWVYRGVITGCAILTLCPYVTSLLLQYFYPTGGRSFRAYRTVLGTAAMMGMAVTVLMAAVCGAVAFAVERRERSAEFLAMLPVRRWHVLLSKLIVAASCVAAMWLLHVGVLAFLDRNDQFKFSRDISNVGLVVFMAFGVAWLCSTFLTSAGLAAGIAIGVTAGLLYAVGAMTDVIVESHVFWEVRGYSGYDYVRAAEYVEGAIRTTALWCGGLCLIGGSIHYLRRVSP